MNLCPNTGEPCPRRKVVHVTEVAGGKVVGTSDHCEGCQVGPLPAAQPSPAPGVPMTLLDLLLGFYKHAMQNQQPGERPEAPRCPGCNVSLAELAREPRVGCGTCYSHFQEQLLPVIQKAQGSVRHVGKVPKRWAEEQAKKQRDEECQMERDADRAMQEVCGNEGRLAQLRDNLKVCVQAEDYETAAMIRDEIRKLSEPPTSP